MNVARPSEILSRREFQVAERYARGENFRDIDKALGVAPATVRTHISKIYRKLEVSTKIALAEALREPFEPGAAPDEPEPHQRTPARRQTATACYLYVDGFAEAARSAQPEELRNRVTQLRKTVSDIAGDTGARVLQHGGGAYALVFGWPQPGELDAESAARAAIGLRDRIAGQGGSRPLAGANVKIALFTGPIIVPPRNAGAAAPTLENVVAGLVDVAADMARLAKPGEIEVCPRTRASLPFAEFASKHGQAANALLVGLRDKRTRIPADADAEATAFVGRAVELDLLAELHGNCRDGFGQAAQIVGEAGIGKSRLIEEVLNRADPDGCRVLMAQCDPMDRAQPFAPIRRLLVQTGDPSLAPAEALRKL